MLLLVALSPISLVPLDTPPVLSNPVFSLATLDEAGRTNMNILTYATPVGIGPRRWCISLFRKTESHANFARRRTGVLQLLSPRHAVLTHTLGGCSSRDVDKADQCASLGFEWEPSEEHEELLLPHCVAYYRLSMEGDFLSAGEHDAAICLLDAVYAGADAVGGSPSLMTAELRALGLVTDAGRAVQPD